MNLIYQSIGLDPAQDQEFVDSIHQLCADLRRSPANLEVKCGSMALPLPVESLLRLESNKITLTDWVMSVCYPALKGSDGRPSVSEGNRFVICRPPDHLLANRARAENSLARWGLSWPNMLALVYHSVGGLPNRYIAWHEALHALGADDCYDLETQAPTCDLQGCVMQYAPTESTVARWPYICASNLCTMSYPGP